MKRLLVFPILLLVSLFAFSQVEYDALRLSQQELNGTARYIGLGGAMGALGGDASSIKDNPAGLGVYRSGEISATFNTSIKSFNTINWNGKNNSQESKSNFGFNNLTYVMNIPSYSNSGLVNSNFSFSYHKLYDYNQSFSMNGNPVGNSFTDYLAKYSSQIPSIPGEISYDNFRMPWLTVLGYDGYLINENGLNFESVLANGEKVTPSYQIDQRGSMSEYNFGWGGNYNNNLFVGFNVNMRSLDYYMKSTLSEDFEKGGNFDLVNKLTQSGFGLNAKLGLIYIPQNNFRLGVAFHTPSISTFTEESYADLHSSLIPANEKKPAQTPINRQSFNLWSPLQAHLSMAYLFGKSALVSAEYNFINYGGARFVSNEESVQNFGEINAAMKDVLNDVHLLKLGFEYKLNPQLAIRAGYAIQTPPIQENYISGKLLVNNSVSTNTEYFNQKYKSEYASLGFGYRDVNWFIDFAYMVKSHQSDFYPYNMDSGVKLEGLNHNIVMTLGLKL